VTEMELWFEFGSTYSYPTALRIEPLARARGVRVLWRPFLLGPVFAEQGWNDSPFNIYPVKGRYMWRDLERICAKLDLPFQRPSRFPRNGLLAARVAVSARDEPWLADFVRGVYTAGFARDEEIARPEVVGGVLERLGCDAAVWLERAAEPETKLRLREETARARVLGIFGAPSFVVGGELFWGNDRLEDALDWAVASAQSAVGGASADSDGRCHR
jgi:2-hydroxychromene-2-carboxylate isomerase